MDRRTEDLRVLRTHTLLLRALSDLLQEKPFDEIRVQDLCQRAMVHRATFYAHFEDKRHLLTFGMQAFLDDLTDGMPCSDNPAPFRQAIEKVFQYFLARRQEYARLFLDPRNAEAKEIFREEFARVLTEQTLHHPAFTAYTREEIVVLCQFFAGGLLSLITWWLKPGTQRSVEEVAEAFCNVYILHAPIPVPEASQDTPAPQTEEALSKNKENSAAP